MQLIELPIDKIKSNGRVRGTEAELNKLAKSMKDWYQPVMVNSAFELIVGRRRLECLKRLGQTKVQVIVNPAFDIAAMAAKAEYDENECRVQYTRKEAIDHFNRMKALAEPEAKNRQTAGLKKGDEDPVVVNSHNGETPEETAVSGPKTRDVAAAGTGMSGQILERANEIVEASKRLGGREMYGDLADAVQQDGAAVSPLHIELKRRGEIFHAIGSAGGARFGDLGEAILKGVKAGNIDTAKIYAEFKKRVKAGTQKKDALHDALGREVPSGLRDLFGDQWLVQAATALEEFGRDTLKAIRSKVQKKGPRYAFVALKETLKAIDLAKLELECAQSNLTEARPYAVCPKCEGKGCKLCRLADWMPKWRYVELKTEGDL